MEKCEGLRDDDGVEGEVAGGGSGTDDCFGDDDLGVGT